MQPASDYYGYDPTMQLARPVVVTGHPGCRLREVAYDLAALTGLAIHDLDHRVAHDAGFSPWRLRCEHGVAAYLDSAARLAPPLLTSLPTGLVVIGEGTLGSHGALAALVKDRATLVFLRLPPATVYWHLRRLYNADRLRHPLLPDRLQHPDDLAPILAACERTSQQADIVLEATEQVHATVMALQDALAPHAQE